MLSLGRDGWHSAAEFHKRVTRSALSVVDKAAQRAREVLAALRCRGEESRSNADCGAPPEAFGSLQYMLCCID